MIRQSSTSKEGTLQVKPILSLLLMHILLELKMTPHLSKSMGEFKFYNWKKKIKNSYCCLYSFSECFHQYLRKPAATKSLLSMCCRLLFDWTLGATWHEVNSFSKLSKFISTSYVQPTFFFSFFFSFTKLSTFRKFLQIRWHRACTGICIEVNDFWAFIITHVTSKMMW